jgi:hypothetical protein
LFTLLKIIKTFINIFKEKEIIYNKSINIISLF